MVSPLQDLSGHPIPEPVPPPVDFKPVNKLVYVKPDPPSKMVGNLYVPVTNDKGESPASTGVVTAIAEGVTLCAVGDVIMYRQMIPCVGRGVDYTAIPEDRIIGVAKGGA